ncbi:MAG: anti-anti-sigma factor [Pseudonocardiales bacterium]|nr:MAG: anti-anti-sigma factor [Pseudonocardiales bacterium]
MGEMASRSGGLDTGAGAVGTKTLDATAPLLLETHFRGRILVVRPGGQLTPATYERLRDRLVNCAAEEPTAIVVDLAGMRATIASLLMVFPTVCDRISDWPGVPFALAAASPPLRTLLNASAVPRFVPTYHSLSEALDDLEAAPRTRRHQIQLPCDPGSPRLARRLVEQSCHQWGIPGMANDAVVIASELTENMVYHARSEGWLRLELRNNRLTVAVADADPRPPQLRVPGLRAVGGRGLVLVDKLSRTWGTASRLPQGKVVWAVLTVASRTHTRPTPSYGRPVTELPAAAAQYSFTN